MKAAFLIKPSKVFDKPLVIKNVKNKDLANDEVRIRVKSCGICKLDLELIEGKREREISEKFPIIPGHEVIGIIDEIGKNVHELNEGDRVALGLIYDSCNSCDACQ
ncbi:MAG TPA: alcohol dehydrogenase catalytic domain-containing protein, partial [Geobacterales bacterium]|nr:alcohol dehydrogenase catalytic domain-containing protein [Geobacterales bacterium]